MIRRVSEEASERQSQENNGQAAEKPDQVFDPGAPFPLKPILPSTVNRRQPQPGRGRRSQSVAGGQGGAYIRAAAPEKTISDIAVAATLRAAAIRQGSRGAEGRRSRGAGEQGGASLRVVPGDLRVKVRRAKMGNLILFVVDASGSMAARQRMISVKGAILSLLLDAYQKRDRVGLIAFRGAGAEVLLPPTNSVDLAERYLRQMPTGGRTPLAAGLNLAGQLLHTHLQRDAALAPLLVLVTDGRANAGQPSHLQRAATNLAQRRIAALVLDSEQGFVRLGMAQQIAVWLEADYLPLDQLQADTVARHVQKRLITR